MAGKGGGNVPKMGKNPKSGGVPASGIRQVDPLVIAAIIGVLILLGGLVWYLAPKLMQQREISQSAPEVIEEFLPSPDRPDPSDDIEGVVKIYYPAGVHVNALQRVAYDQTPPFGGPHDEVWATCTGIVYEQPLRSENAVHALEHGSIWITYDPETISDEDLQTLSNEVTGEQYLFMSPFPGQGDPISIQSWGHQLKLTSADDERIDQFITALRRNTQTGVYEEDPQMTAYPEPQATCAALPGAFDPDNPPPAGVGEPGPDAVRMDGSNATESAPSPMPVG